MSAKHTPGPWTVERDGPNRKWLVNAEEFGVATCDGAFENQAADARLIAAAPDLLAVLQEIVDADDEAVKALEELGCVDPECVKLTNKARAAIAKATGEQQ